MPLGNSAGGDHLCGACLRKPPYFHRARAALLYHGPIATAIRAFKYRGELTGLKSFAAFAHTPPGLEELGTQLWDYILPIPLHLKRLRTRGFNQALLLAQHFLPQAKNKIVADLLLRQRWTEPQTGMSGGQRRRNLKNAFTLARPELIKSRNILLIDDVFTTGSTVNECARVLRDAKAARVDVFTLARVHD